VPLDRALISYYRLSIVAMTLTAAVWPQFALHVFRVESEIKYPSLEGIGSGTAGLRSGNCI